MLKNFSISLLGVSALSVGLALTSSSAWAADLPAGDYAAGGVVLTLAKDGTFHANQGKESKVSGKYTVSGNQVKFTDLAGEWACKADVVGTYGWKLDAGTLTLSKVSDACDDRSGSLTHAPWKAQK